jgi:serine/threonine protein kinase
VDRGQLQARIGSSLRGKWTLEKLLGWGGVGAVYLARHAIGRHDAIKILHAELMELPGLRERFEIEARAANRFRHPSAVEVRDLDHTEDGVPFLVMGLVEGETLAQRLRTQKIDPGDLLAWIGEVLDVLTSAHREGIVHRDIKPDNLLLTRDGKLKVLDFGVARLPGADLTDPGVAVGTVAYMAPEQIRGLGVDHRADVFAVGATMFRVLAGRQVHLAEGTPGAVFAAGLRSAPPLLSLVPDAGRGIAQIVDRALAFHAHERYPDAATMRADVLAVAGGGDPPFASAQAAPPSTVSLPDAGAATKRDRASAASAPSAPAASASPAPVPETKTAASADPSSSAATPTAISPGASGVHADPPAPGDGFEPAPATVRMPRSWGRIAAIPLLAVSVLVLLVGGFALLNEIRSVSRGKSNLAGWTLVAVFVVPGVLMLLSAFRLRRGLSEPTVRAVLRLARHKGGRLTATELVADTSLSRDEAEQALALLESSGVCKREDGPRKSYVFDDLVSR